MKRIAVSLLVVATFTSTSGCAAAKLASVAGKAAKGGSVAVKAGGTVAKTGAAAKAVAKGTAVMAVTQVDDLARMGRLAENAESVVLVGSELPKATKAVSKMEPELLDHFLTGLDVAELLSGNWGEDDKDYQLGEGGPEGMGKAFRSFPDTSAISPAKPSGENYWVQWLHRPEGNRLGVYHAKSDRVALMEPKLKK